MFAYFFLASAGFVISLAGVEWVRRNALRLNRMDLPNERSSHTVPTPRGGGVGIVASVISLWLVGLVLWSDQIDIPVGMALMYAVAGGVLALIGWLDDRHSLSVVTRFVPYLAVITLFVAVTGTFTQIELPLIGNVAFWQPISVVLTLLWLTGFLNLFNFMDGIDGLAAMQAILASLFWLIVFLVEGQVKLAQLAVLIAAASVGFFILNKPPARIFMGDAGSTFLGFSLAAFPLMGYAQTGDSKLLVAGVLVLMPFLFDSVLTIFRRLRHKQNIFKPHRSHLYQRLTIAGYSHGQVTSQYTILMLVSGALGFMYLGSADWLGLAEIAAAVLIHVLYAIYVSMIEVNKTKQPEF